MISQVPDMYPHEQLKVHSAVVGGGDWWQKLMAPVGGSGEKLQFFLFLVS